MEKTLVIKDQIKTNLAITSEKARRIEEIVLESVKNKQQIELDFSGIDTLTTAFLNVAIGSLYTKYNPTILNKYVHIKASSLTPFQQSKIQLVMQNAKAKLSNNDINEELFNGK
jgi:hypothetical protein|nr:MAG TPA: protein of unknown function DUF4325 [Caudoviricetes sp.]